MFPKTEQCSVFQRKSDLARASFSNVRPKISPAFFRTPGGDYYMLGLRPKPKRGFHPHAPERGRPRGRSAKFSGILRFVFRENDLLKILSVQKFLGVWDLFSKKVPRPSPPFSPFFSLKCLNTVCVCAKIRSRGDFSAPYLKNGGKLSWNVKL